ncbi:putative S-adenosyl-L-methionine-dependent methyltransferase [Cynara cardunculus var. scolymus]|uniref:Putative S-adenosyl-L-methionine-dependent methyltransferase n=1 Tax=Cynara cardunculus var. scolymus TaxID=59895 RepID=A0A103Y5W6_CYNCS|nr:putative S-adenosyl-L-methionine-dependent methyltransferase [Cynara cardunculus var. scolymus]
MDSPRRIGSISINLFYLFLLLSSNLLTLFISTTFYSSSSLNPTRNIAMIIDAANATQLPLDTANFKGTSDISPEFLAFTSPKQLPFGMNSNFDSDKLYPPVGKACTLFPNELNRYMSYKVNESCPDDELLAQKLLLKGCEPLPRRRCRPAAPPEYVEPHPIPESFWSTPSDSSVVWTAYTCKNYSCLISRKHNQKGFDDCKDCFDLGGREKARWTESKSRGSIDFGIDEVLKVKKHGTIRIGLDIGGGVGTFAVRMRERNITIITTSMNLNGPFNSFIASRGVVPMYISISQRLPFFDNTLDIVHSMHVLSNWLPTTLMHFLFFDIYRVLRPGGLFWLDHFFCKGEQLEEVYIPLLESIGFNKVKWVVGRKLDRGIELQEIYLSALLEKPLTNSW